MNFKGRKILITAGPTWVALDSVRVISNIATGQTGIMLAEKLRSLGAGVTLLLGPVGACGLGRGIRILRYNFFQELEKLIAAELMAVKFDVVIHSAAVSDYRPAAHAAKKVKSGKKSWSLKLFPTRKIIDEIKKIDPAVFLVGFKFEPEADKTSLIKGARVLMERSGLDLVVVNTVRENQYQAYLVNKDTCGPFSTKNQLANRLVLELNSIPMRVWR